MMLRAAYWLGWMAHCLWDLTFPNRTPYDRRITLQLLKQGPPKGPTP